MNNSEPVTRSLLCPRPDLVAIRVTGGDARTFLHAQTTQAIRDLPENGVRRAAWLSAKGRVRAIFDVVADGATIWLVTAADMAEQVVNQLSMYVLRADVKLELASGRTIWSVVGDAVEEPSAKELSQESNHSDNRTASTAIAATRNAWNPTASTGPEGEISYAIDDGLVMIITNGADIPKTVAGKFARPGEGTLNDANLALIRRGIPSVSSETFERYIPQMLNLDQLDAISFTKGCYPGQEIVARTTNLGEVKRRIQRFSASAANRDKIPSPGDEITDTDGKTIGEVNRAATTATGELELLAVASLDQADQESLSLGDGHALQRHHSLD